MGKAIEAIEQVSGRVGILAALLVFWMYLQIQDLEKRVENLDQTTKDLAEVKGKVASMDAKLEIILSDFVSRRDKKSNDP